MSRRPFLGFCAAIASLLTVAPLRAEEWQTGTYTYDLSGNITAVGTHTFVYDAAGRLKSGTYGPTQKQEYTYDDFGNILTITTQGSPVTSMLAANPANNRLDRPGAGFNVFAGYDDRGNMTSYLGTETFTYDALGVMTTSRSPMGAETFHVYGADDERVGSIALNGSAAGSANWTLRDLSGKVLRTIDEAANGTLSWKKDYIYRGSQLLSAAVPTSDKVLQYHLDHLGTPRLVTSNGGVKVATSTYYPFGQEATATTTDTGTLKFTGHERDLPTLDYMHARYYGPMMGRFLVVDPVIDFKTNLRNPPGWNRYSYVRNNPMRWTDPTGKVIAYDDEFRRRVKYDVEFRKAFEAWKKTKSGAAQWKTMAGDTNTKYTFSVRQVKEMTAPLVETEVYGSTRPIVGPQNENKSGKLDMPNVTMAINVDYIKSTLQNVPEIISREIAKTIFHEAAHGLDFGSNSKSARQALSVDQQWQNGTEPRMNLFERELSQVLPPPDWD